MMTPEIENEILKLKLQIRELELKIEALKVTSPIYIYPSYPSIPYNPYYWPTITCSSTTQGNVT